VPVLEAPELTRIAEAVRPSVRIVNALRADQDRLIPPFQAELYREFELLSHVVIASLNAEGGLIMEATQRERDRINAIVGGAGIGAWMATRMAPLFEHQYRRVAEATMVTLSRENVPVTLRDQMMSRILEEGGKRMGMLDIPGDTKATLFRILDEGKAAGLNPRQTARAIEGMIPKGRFVNAGSHYRAQLIARTETLNAQRISSIEMYRDSPAVTAVVAMDGESDEECAARNGQTFSYSEAEYEADVTHPNCVLAFAPVTTPQPLPAQRMSNPSVSGLQKGAPAARLKELRQSVRTCVNRINGIHDWPDEDALYAEPLSIWKTADLSINGRYIPKFGRLDLNPALLTDRMAQRETIYHELGHRLDNLFGKVVNLRGEEPQLTNYFRMGIDYAGKPGELVDAFRELWLEMKRLPAWENLKEWRYIDKDWYDYAKKPDEMWARAYAQFVLTETNDELALNYLGNKSGQWTAEEFERLRPLIRKLLEVGSK
jgi:hypothetical protein